jgi:hypothetical protein
MHLPRLHRNKETMQITKKDKYIVRELAQQVAEIAALPEQGFRRQLWASHNDLKSKRPMILVFPEGSWEEIITEGNLLCEGDEARTIERQLRMRVYYYEHFQDDTVIEKDWIVHKVVHNSGWGLEPQRIPSPERRGAWIFDPVIHSPDDLKRLHFPEINYDSTATKYELTQMQELFGDILDVRLKGISHISYHLMQQYTYLRGLEQTMMDMVLNPEWLHEAMTFLMEGQQYVLSQMIDLNLLSLNNDATYQNSGGNGYTNTLPAPGYNPESVRPIDMWASAESQELAGVSPKMHAEFALQYEKKLLSPFGLTGYGCCEDLSRKLDDVLTIPNIRRVSISPFADVDISAEKLRGKVIFSWKPNPAHLVGRFDEERIHRYIHHAVEVTQRNECVLEIILKDTHTCEGHPERFDQWLAIARGVREVFDYA